jgi:hypothetical protein
LVLESGGLQNLVLEVIRRPTRTGWRMAEGRAGVNADGQAVLFRGAIDRPETAMAERPVAHHQQQHLHEALIRSTALDLGDGEFHVLRRHQDRSAQPRFAIEPLMGDPAINRLA